jgi:hypothetical protein
MSTATGEVGRSRKQRAPDRRLTKRWHQRPWLGASGRGARPGEVVVRVDDRTNATAMEALAAMTRDVGPGAGTFLVEGSSWASPEDREAAVQSACEALGILYEAVPRDGKDHMVRVQDDDVSLVEDRDSESYSRWHKDETNLRWRSNEARKGSIRHSECSSVVVNGLLGQGLVLCFDGGPGA